METNPSGNNLTNYLVPNSTQIPHVLIRQWLPLLKDTELRVLLVIADQTLGWVADPVTKRRKEDDWINNWQLQKRTGKSHQAIRTAIQSLFDHALILIYSENGELLDTKQKRIAAGSRLYFRLNTLGLTQQQLFDGNPSKKLRGNVNKRENGDFKGTPQKIRGAKNLRATKETVFTKINTSNNNAGVAKDNNQTDLEAESQEEVTGNKPVKPEILPTRVLIAKFKRYCEDIRKQTPVFTRYKDGALIKWALKRLHQHEVEMLFIWFLRDRRQMAPTIGAALSLGTIEGFRQQIREQYGFYSDMDRLLRQYEPYPVNGDPLNSGNNMAAKLAMLVEMKQKLFKPQTDQNAKQAILGQVPQRPNSAAAGTG